MSVDIVVAQPVDESVRLRLEACGTVFVNPGPEPLSADDLRAQCHQASALMAFMTERLDARFISECPHLQIVAGALKGFDNIDVEACSKRGVAVSIVPDLLTEPTAELALGLMIAVARNVLPGDRYIRDGAFAGWRPRLFGGSINGSTVGLFGAGRVGQALMTLLSGFRCECLYYDAERLDPALEARVGAKYCSLEQLRAEADFLVLALPLTEQTLGLVDHAFIDNMKPGSYLINPARGSLVNEAAIVAGLESGHLAGYAADVFEAEDWAREDRPAGIHPNLLASEKCVLTPHIGSGVTDVRRQIVNSAADSIISVLSGTLPATVINTTQMQEKQVC